MSRKVVSPLTSPRLSPWTQSAAKLPKVPSLVILNQPSYSTAATQQVQIERREPNSPTLRKFKDKSIIGDTVGSPIFRTQPSANIDAQSLLVCI